MPRGKGSKFERDLCRKLSQWWLGDEDADVVFWRTSQSGGRATERRKKGKKTAAGHHGDISSIDPRSRAFTGLITPEAKRGINKASPCTLLDRTKKQRPTAFEEFLHQAISASENAGTPYWCLIHKRDSREEVIYIPYGLYATLRNRCGPHIGPVSTYNGKYKKPSGKFAGVWFAGMRLDDFLDWVKPSTLKVMYREHKDAS